MRNTILLLLIALLEVACSGFKTSSGLLSSVSESSVEEVGSTLPPPNTANPPSAPTPTPLPTATPVAPLRPVATPNPLNTNCREADLKAAFQTSYWPVFQSKCVGCHGAGVTGRAFASANLVEAFSSFKLASGGGFKDAQARANAVNSAHGSPATNGSFNQTFIDQAHAKFTQGVAAACTTLVNPTPTATPGPTPASAVSGTTLGVMNQNTVLAAFTRMTGLAPSPSTSKNIYTEHSNLKNYHASRRFILPPTSSVSNVSSSTYMMTLVIAAEHCNDLINAEAALPAASRKFFNEANFSASSLDSITNGQVDLITSRIAKRFWRREITASEISVFQQLLTESKTAGSSVKQAMLDICLVASSSHSATAR